MFLKESISFQEHARFGNQYNAVRKLKSKLPENHVTLQMDFAEHYMTCYQEEVQSAYYDRA